jgi:hypothetical protein
MAAVSSTSPVHDPDSVVAVRDFLQSAVALYRDVLAVYHDGDASSAEGPLGLSDDLLSAHHARLRDSVQALARVQPVVVAPDLPHPLTTVPGACYKVAQDLVLHLDRAISPAHAPQSQPASSYRDIWPTRDVAALGARLQHLSQQFHDEFDHTYE